MNKAGILFAIFVIVASFVVLGCSNPSLDNANTDGDTTVNTQTDTTTNSDGTGVIDTSDTGLNTDIDGLEDNLTEEDPTGEFDDW